MTFDIGLNEVYVRVGGRAGVRYVITKFTRMDSLPNFVTHGAPLSFKNYGIIRVGLASGTSAINHALFLPLI